VTTKIATNRYIGPWTEGPKRMLAAFAPDYKERNRQTDVQAAERCFTLYAMDASSVTRSKKTVTFTVLQGSAETLIS